MKKPVAEMPNPDDFHRRHQQLLELMAEVEAMLAANRATVLSVLTTCPRCGRTSCHLTHSHEGYCTTCKAWYEDHR